MKKEILEAIDAVDKAIIRGYHNETGLATQFDGPARESLSKIKFDLLKILDACVESEQINSGLN